MKIDIYKYIIEIFILLKNNIINILNDKFLFFNKKSDYKNCIIELSNVLKNTLDSVENIYCKYILYPKLQNYYDNNFILNG